MILEGPTAVDAICTYGTMEVGRKVEETRGGRGERDTDAQR